ncbi:unnamed protein product [Symbiodinium natans]|uniref:Uncharacterized protein n=1 Tax=Symbiodinium natans TaxID=878477 RepID=A0A812TA92_9DINO|nr:unnamed protein product [Symbiodinium natans]
MWTPDDSHQPLGIVPSSAPRGDTRLPRLPGEVDINMDLPDVHFEAQRRGSRGRRTTPGGTDLAAMSRKRRDVALAGRENVLDVGITLPAPRALPGTLLKSSTKPVRARASPVEAPSFTVPEPMGAGAHLAPLEPPEGKTELQKLQEDLRLQSADLNRYRSALKKKNEEYEGCMALLNVTQAELRLCQERIRTQSPTPPVNAPRRLQGINVFGSERELAEEAAAFAVSSLLGRVQLRMRATQEQEKLEKERERKKQAQKGKQSPLPPVEQTAALAGPSTLQTSGNAGRSNPDVDSSKAMRHDQGKPTAATAHTGSLGPASERPAPAPVPGQHPASTAATAATAQGLPDTGSLGQPSEGPPPAPHTGSPEATPMPEDATDTDALQASPVRPRAAAPAEQAAQVRPPAPRTQVAAGLPAKNAGASEGKNVEAQESDTDKLLQQCLQEQDQELDAEALQAASKDQPEAYTPAQSPPPDTGGTPTPAPYGQEESLQFAD